MPSRTLGSRAIRSKPSSVPSDSYYKRAVPFHGSLITILGVTFLLMSIAIWLVLLVYVIRLDNLERKLMLGQINSANCDYKIGSLEKKMLSGLETTPPTGTTGSLIPSATSPTAVLPPEITDTGKSLSGKLVRGSLSPDGTKYAGYEETEKGKIGIAVEIVATGKIRYIVIFNPNTESTGAGSVLAQNMSVRWVDDKTIEYDLLISKNGGQVKDTERVAIFF
ncbi:MAG: hypothetical protein ABIB04_02875 [Patescibacteria group bacterium]